MSSSICALMKKSALLSAILILIGISLELLVIVFSFSSVTAVAISYLGLYVIFSGIVVMLLTIISIMIPRVSKKLDTCQH